MSDNTLYPLEGNAEDTIWFENSYNAAMELAQLNDFYGPDSVDSFYESIYNVTLLLDSRQWVDKVKFNSAEDAVMFIMKWS